MTDKENKIADILLDFYDEYHSNEINRPMIPSIYASKILDSLQEEPVSEELEEAAEKYAYELFPSVGVANTETELAFKAGAKWQFNQLEKNRLKHCNSITNEQAELEQGFIDQHLDKHQRMPTFLDAIEYGMRLQKEQMMAKAIDGEVVATSDNGWESIRFYKKEHHCGQKVKVIVIKEN